MLGVYSSEQLSELQVLSPNKKHVSLFKSIIDTSVFLLTVTLRTEFRSVTFLSSILWDC